MSQAAPGRAGSSVANGAPHAFMYPGLGKAGFNWFGTTPTIADTQYEPNFRHFDWFLDRNPGNVDLIERVWKVPEGEAHWNQLEYTGGNFKALPAVISGVFAAQVSTYMGTKAMQKSPQQWRWYWWVAFATCYLYSNIKGLGSREKMFQRDFQRNQMYAQDEFMRLRKDLRVRQALYELQHVHDPVTEYKLKEFLVSKEMN